MRIGPAVIGFGVLTVLYVGALVYIDRQNWVFAHGVALAFLLPQVALFALLSFTLRAARWRWLLSRRGFHVRRVAGFLAYVSGFALTASPGKLGELLRVRYFGALAVPADQVIACFVFERMLDLIVVMLLASLVAGLAPGGLMTPFVFVALVVAAIIALSRSTYLWVWLAQRLHHARWQASAVLSLAVGQGLAGAARFLRPRELAVSTMLGAAAWAIQSAGCAYLLASIGIVVPPLAGFALYPLALLVGAASMLPGGIGTTEAAIIVMLHGFGVPLERAALAAVGMRLSTLWFAIGLGLLAVAILESAAWKSGHRNLPAKSAKPQ